MTSTSAKLDVFDEPLFDNSLVSLHEHTYKPYGSPYYRNSDEIRIPIHFQDLILDIAESYIYIQGKFTPSDANKVCYLSNNALAFLFDEIRYEMGGEQVAVIRKPGVTTTMKTMVSCGQMQLKTLLSYGWGLTEEKQDILDTTTHVFSGKLPLKYLMGFAEDYTRGILNTKQELTLIIARSFKNCYLGEVDADIEINKIEWRIRHIVPEDRQKLKLLNRVNKGGVNAKIKMAYRMWDLYELPTLRKTATDIWAIKTTNSLERPRYIIIGFQSTDSSDNRSKDVTQFVHADISNIRTYLNSEVYPYERWNLDFGKKLDSAAYYAYENFQRGFYGKDNCEPMMDIGEFRKNPLFIIDCSHQQDAMKSSTVDIKLEFETREKNFPENTRVYALIIHDAYLAYNALDGSVHNGFK
uniref:Double jelly roll-like domain-containing protein n=1 Tax=Anoplophora glabripennis TaxID=217634 RepID=V5FZL3_ANOGL